MDTLPNRACVRYVVEVWVDVDAAEESVDRVVVNTVGLSNPQELRSFDGKTLSAVERAAVLNVVASDTWPSWVFV